VPSHNPPYPSGGYNAGNSGYNAGNSGYNSYNSGYNSPNNGYNNGYSSPSSGYVSPASGYAGRSPGSNTLPVIVGLPESDSGNVSEFAKSAKHFDKSAVNFGN
jgi:hypothetical protein